MTATPTVLLLRALGLGDFLTAVPALRAVADTFPEHCRALAAPVALRPLAEVSGAVDEVVDAAPLGAVHLGSPPEVAVNLHGSGPQSHRVLLATRPDRLVAFANRDVPESTGGPVWDEREHEVQRWCRLLSESGIPADPTRLQLPAPPAPRDPTAVGATIVHPGAASEARRWPAERWGAVARLETAAGRRVLVTGTAAERRLAETVAHAAGLGTDAVLAGETDLAGVAAVVAAAGLVLCGDTGVAHLATAFGTPSVVVFGPTSPARWGPPPERRRHVALWAGRSGDPHSRRPDPGLLEIGVDDVLAGIQRARSEPRELTGAGVVQS